MIINAMPGGSALDPSAATATASDILSGKTAYNGNGEIITGNIPNYSGSNPIVPGSSSHTISSPCYVRTSITVNGDANLQANNIKSGVSIFGVNGTYPNWSNEITATISGETEQSLTFSNVSAKPKMMMVYVKAYEDTNINPEYISQIFNIDGSDVTNCVTTTARTWNEGQGPQVSTYNGTGDNKPLANVTYNNSTVTFTAHNFMARMACFCPGTWGFKYTT